MTFINLWATRAGVSADRTLLIGAHWDAKEDAKGGGVVPGANDGASGMGILLELQRTIVNNDIRLPYNLVFAFFDGEDGFNDCHPLAGSLYFANHMPMPIDRMILLDMVGDEEARFLYEGASAMADPDLMNLVWAKAKTHGLGKNFTKVRSEIVDDHRPFIDAGVPSIDIIDHAQLNRADVRGGNSGQIEELKGQRLVHACQATIGSGPRTGRRTEIQLADLRTPRLTVVVTR